MNSTTRANHGHVVPQWIKARRSTNANACVEVMADRRHWHVRDSKHAPTGLILTLDGSEWDQLCEVLLDAADERFDGLRNGEFSAVHLSAG